MVSCGMFTKWKIDLDGFEKYRFDEDGNLWRLPYTSKIKSYSLRKLSMCKIKKRWVIKGRWWSQSQLRPHLVLDDSPIEITKSKDLPF